MGDVRFLDDRLPYLSVADVPAAGCFQIKSDDASLAASIAEVAGRRVDFGESAAVAVPQTQQRVPESHGQLVRVTRYVLHGANRALQGLQSVAQA